MEISPRVSPIVFLLLLLCGLCVRFVPEVRSSLPFEDDKMLVHVYAVSLDGVGSVGIGNTTKTLEGIEHAIEHLVTWNLAVDFAGRESEYDYYLNVSRFIGHPHQHGWVLTWLDTDFQANVTLNIVRDWATYRSVVENGQECIIVNTHGAVLPVPEDVSREAWADKIAEAMLYRNVTWVHVAGHPFYYSWTQGEASLQQWGDAGFQRLMQHIGKGDITVRNAMPARDVSMTGKAEVYLKDTWVAIYAAKQVTPDYTLAAKSLEGYEALDIWSGWEDAYDGSEYYTGIVVSFKEQLNATSHGFYVHIGANKTFDSDGDLKNPDFWRAYMGTACGLWSLVSRTARDALIGEAEAMIEKAADEGRTYGLDKARGFLEKAKEWNIQYADDECFMNAYCAMLAATEAEKPKSVLPVVLLTGLGISAVVVAVGIVVWRRREDNGD
jgi:hypothetical protein